MVALVERMLELNKKLPAAQTDQEKTALQRLEVLFSDAPGYMRETDNDAVMERVDESGQVIGFSIMQVSRLSRSKPLTAELLPVPN